MGVHPNDSGNKCISDLIWEADTLEPGVTPLKWKLSLPEPPKTDICNREREKGQGTVGVRPHEQ